MCSVEWGKYSLLWEEALCIPIKNQDRRFAPVSLPIERAVQTVPGPASISLG